VIRKAKPIEEPDKNNALERYLLSMESTEKTQIKNIAKLIKEEELPNKTQEELIELVKELRKENLS